MREESPIGRSLLTGLSLVAPVSPFLAQPEIAAIVQPAERSQTEENVLTNVPVFVEEGAELDVSDIRAIENDVNLRPTPSTDKPPVAVLEDGSFVEVQNPPIIGKDHNWITTTVLYTEGNVITDTTAPENHGYLAVELSGKPVDLTTLPPELITALERENLAPISFTGEFSYTQVLKSLEGIGGQVEVNQFITSLFNRPETIQDGNGKQQSFMEYAASGEDPLATFDLLTGIAILEKATGEDLFPNIPKTTAVEVKTDIEGNVENWTAVVLRLPVNNSEDLYYVNSGNRIANGEEPTYYNNTNTLFTYPQLKKYSGDQIANDAAARAPIVEGLVKEAGNVTIPDENLLLTTLIEEIDSVFTGDLGVVELPGDQELQKHLTEGQEIGSIVYADNTVNALDSNGEELFTLRPKHSTANDSVEWQVSEKQVEYDNNYLSQILLQKPLKQFEKNPLTFTTFTETSDTRVLIPIGETNGFSESDAANIGIAYNTLYENSASFATFIKDTRLRSIVNYTYPEERGNILASPNYFTWFSPEKKHVSIDANGQPQLSPEGKGTWGNIYVIQVEYSSLKEWAKSIDINNYEQVLQGLTTGVLLHEASRISNASKTSSAGIHDDPSLKEEALLRDILNDYQANGVVMNENLRKGLDAVMAHLQNFQ